MEFNLGTVTKEKFLDQVNRLRRDYKDKWIFINASVDGMHVTIKNYNTYLQIYHIDGSRINWGSGSGDIKVSEWKEMLADGLERAQEMALAA